MENKKQFSKIGLVMFIGTIIIFTAQLLVAHMTAKIPVIAESGSLSFLISMLSMYLFGFTAIFFMFKKIPAQAVPKKKMRASHVVVTFLMCFAGSYILMGAMQIFTTIITLLTFDPADMAVANTGSSVNLLVQFFILVICAPILEELLFRKAIIDRTLKYGEGVAIIVSSIIFGLFHGNLVQSCYVLVLGFFTGLLYVKTGNIKYSIIIHMLFNFTGAFSQAWVLETYTKAMDKLSETLFSASGAQITVAMLGDIAACFSLVVYVGCVLGFIIAGIVLFCVNVRKMKLFRGEVSIEKGKRFKTIFLNAGMILYSLFWIAMIVYRLIGIG